MAGGEGESEESADGGAHDSVQFFDPKVIKERDVCIDKIRGIEVGKRRSVGLPSCRIGGGWASRSVAAAEVVRADDEVAVGVDRFPWSHHFIPPAIMKFFGPEVAAFGWFGMSSASMMGSRERVEEENGIRLIFIELAPSRVGELGIRQ